MKTKLLFRAMVGSRAQNLATPESDTDFRYVVVTPLPILLSPFRQAARNHAPEDRRDDVAWELRDFIKHATNGNPTVYKALFGPMDFAIEGTEFITSDALHGFAAEIKANRHRFLSGRRIYESYQGYSSSQLRRFDAHQPTFRDRKLIATMLRVLYQGACLLRGGDLDPRLPDDSELREFLMEVKLNYRPNMWPEVQRRRDALLADLDAAYATTKLGEPDFAYLEDLNARIYSET